MPLSINTNIASLTAQRAMLNTSQELETAFERLSTGKRVNTAVDDAAGLAIAERLTGRINGLNQAIRNANDGVSVVQIAEGAQDEVTTIIQRLRDLAVQGANSSLSSIERSFLETEADKLLQSMTQAAGMAEFSGNELLLGDTGTTDTPSLAFRIAWFKPLIRPVRRSAIARPAASSTAVFTRFPVDKRSKAVSSSRPVFNIAR